MQKVCNSFNSWNRNLHSFLWEAGIKQCSQKIVVTTSSHRDVLFDKAVLHLRSNSLKSICKNVQFLVNLNVIGLQCNFTKSESFQEAFFKAFGHGCVTFISHYNFSQNNYFCKIPFESYFWKCGELIRVTCGKKKFHHTDQKLH